LHFLLVKTIFIHTIRRRCGLKQLGRFLGLALTISAGFSAASFLPLHRQKLARTVSGSLA